MPVQKGKTAIDVSLLPLIVRSLLLGQNRVIAGVHYPKDHVVGQGVARWIYNSLLSALPAGSKFQYLLSAASTELRHQWADAP
jgi:membrane-associated phospholipid phosphatase